LVGAEDGEAAGEGEIPILSAASIPGSLGDGGPMVWAPTRQCPSHPMARAPIPQCPPRPITRSGGIPNGGRTKAME